VIPGIGCQRAQLNTCIGLLSEHEFSAVEVVAEDISKFELGIYRGGVFSCACLNIDYPVLSVVDTTDGGEREKSKPHVVIIFDSSCSGNLSKPGDCRFTVHCHFRRLELLRKYRIVPLSSDFND
jgi:hypothetical protein